jgi:tRNA U55 pseudouridine synthase TruB
MTSRRVVDRVNRFVRPARCGHAGTLDPLATGVLVVCIGQATRLIEHVQRMPKTYDGTFLLGRTSDTLMLGTYLEVSQHGLLREQIVSLRTTEVVVDIPGSTHSSAADSTSLNSAQCLCLGNSTFKRPHRRGVNVDDGGGDVSLLGQLHMSIGRPVSSVFT